MMKLVLNRFRTVRGAVVGRLSQEIADCKGGVVDHEHICDTVEREEGCLEPGEYRVVVAKCRSFARKMMFLEAVKKEASSSSDASSGLGYSPLPLPEICERCRLERKHHSMELRTAFSAKGSVHPFVRRTALTPAAAALRRIVPILPGSCTASSST